MHERSTYLLLLMSAGIMGELTSGNADIAAFPLSLTLPRPTYVDLSYSYLNGGIGILVRT